MGPYPGARVAIKSTFGSSVDGEQGTILADLRNTPDGTVNHAFLVLLDRTVTYQDLGDTWQSQVFFAAPEDLVFIIDYEQEDEDGNESYADYDYLYQDERETEPEVYHFPIPGYADRRPGYDQDDDPALD